MCLKPYKLCQELLAKTKNKQCYLKFSKKTNKTNSLLCKVDGHRHHFKVCAATTPKVAHGCIIIGAEAEECSGESVANDPLMGAGSPSSTETLEGSTTTDVEYCSSATELSCEEEWEGSARRSAAPPPPPSPTQTQKPLLDYRQKIVCNIVDHRTNTDVPSVMFQMQRMLGSINDKKLWFVVTYDTGAAITCLMIPKHLRGKLIPDRRQNIHLTTATGQSDKQHNIYDVRLCSEASDILLNAIEIQSLPLPQVNPHLKQLMNNYGYDSVPSSKEIKDSVYILLGASHLPLHPSSGKCRLIPRQLHEKYPGLRLFISKIDGQKILAGCLVGKGEHYTITYKHTKTQTHK